MDLYPDSTSNSELDGCGNPDYNGHFETAGSECDCELATSSSKASAVRRNCYSEKNSILKKACSPAAENISESIKCKSNGCILGRLDGADSPDSW